MGRRWFTPSRLHLIAARTPVLRPPRHLAAFPARPTACRYGHCTSPDPKPFDPLPSLPYICLRAKEVRRTAAVASTATVLRMPCTHTASPAVLHLRSVG